VCVDAVLLKTQMLGKCCWAINWTSHMWYIVLEWRRRLILFQFLPLVYLVIYFNVVITVKDWY